MKTKFTNYYQTKGLVLILIFYCTLLQGYAQTITLTSNFNAFTSCGGSNSSSQSFAVGGTGLTANINLTVPFGFELSTTSSGTYYSTLALTPTSGTVSSTTLFIRLMNSISGSPSGNLTASSTGATNKTSALSGTVTNSIANNTVTANQTICYNSTPASLTGATPTGGNGSSYTYLWQRSITGANSGFGPALNTNTLINYQPTALTQKTWFRRVVSSGVGACAADTSAAITISVDTLIANNIATGNQTICYNSTPTSLTGATPIGGNGSSYTYLWQRSTTSANAGFGAALNTNTLINYQPTALTQKTWFRRVVSSGACAADTSAAIAISVDTLIANNTATGNQTICYNSTPASLIGTSPSGGNKTTYTYLWQRSTTSANAGFGAALNTNTLINYQPTALTQKTWFRRVVSSGACAADTSAAIAISVDTLIANNTATGNQTICYNSTPTSLTGATPIGGNGSSYTYLWQRSTTSANVGFGAALNTNTLINYQPTALTQKTWFRRVVSSGACAADTSAAIAISVDTLIANNTATGNQTICYNSTPTSLIGTSPSGGNKTTYTYLWQRSTTSANAGFAPALNTNTLINYQPTALTQKTWFRRVVSSGACAADTSAAIAISVDTLIANNTATGNQTICYNSTPASLIGATPAGGNGSSYTYLWQRSSTSATAGFAPALNTNTLINYQPTALTQKTWFRRVVSSGACAADTSAAIAISVDTLIANNTATGNQTICYNSTPTSLTGATPIGGNGSSYTYLWQRSSTSATAGFGAALNTNTLINYQPTALTQKTWFRRVVSSGVCAADTSAAIAISVDTLIANNAVSGVRPICVNSIPNLLIGSTPMGGNGSNYTYLWQRSTISATMGFSAALNSNTLVNYQPTALSQNTWFRRVVSSGACASDTSVAILVSVDTLIANNTATGNQTICYNSTPASLTGATPTGGNKTTYTYLWQRSTTVANSGFSQALNTNTLVNYQPTALTQKTWFRRVVSSGACAADTSAAIAISVDTFPAKPIISRIGITDSLNSSVNAFSYAWKLNGNTIANAITRKIAAKSSGTYIVEVANSTGCKTASDPFIFVKTRVDNIANPIDVAIYPNPSNTGLVTLKLNKVQTNNLILRIYDIQGSVIKENEVEVNIGSSEILIDMKNQQSGIYFVNIQLDNETLVRRIFLNN